MIHLGSPSNHGPLTVRELIPLLAALHPDAAVVIDDDGNVGGMLPTPTTAEQLMARQMLWHALPDDDDALALLAMIGCPAPCVGVVNDTGWHLECERRAREALTALREIARGGADNPGGGPDDGHTFRLTFASRGSYGVAGVEGHTDAEDWSTPNVVEVRAWNVRDALRLASRLKLGEWRRTEDARASDPAYLAGVRLGRAAERRRMVEKLSSAGQKALIGLITELAREDPDA